MIYYLIDLCCSSFVSYADAGPSATSAAAAQQQANNLEQSTAPGPLSTAAAAAAAQTSGFNELHAALQTANISAKPAASQQQSDNLQQSSVPRPLPTGAAAGDAATSAAASIIGVDELHAALQDARRSTKPAAAAAQHQANIPGRSTRHKVLPADALAAAAGAGAEAGDVARGTPADQLFAALQKAAASKPAAAARAPESHAANASATGSDSKPAGQCGHPAEHGGSSNTVSETESRSASADSIAAGQHTSSSHGSSSAASPAIQATVATPAKAAAGQHGGSSSAAERLQEMLHKKPCRACTTATDMFSAAFRASQLAHSTSSSSSSSGSSSRSGVAHAPQTGSSSSSESSDSPAATAQPAAGLVFATNSSSSSSSSSSSEEREQDANPADQQQQQQQHHHQQQQQQQQQQPFWFYEDEMPCPPDILELGRSTWTLLHSMAAYYPDEPTAHQQQQMSDFIAALGQFYPCQECAGHLRKELQKHPPDVTSSVALSDWMCRLHNLVNVRLGKPEFDCSKVFERWRDGPADDEDACPTGH